jgi:hypothetical protein
MRIHDYKNCPTTHHAGTKGERMYSSYSFASNSFSLYSVLKFIHHKTDLKQYGSGIKQKHARKYNQSS